MKRFLIMLLALALLCGCAVQESEPAPETPDAPAPTEITPPEPLTLVTDDGHVEDPWDWVWFYWNTQATGLYVNEDACTIEIINRYPADELDAAREFHSTLTYNGEVFTLTEAEGTFTYKYLVYSSSQMPPQSKYDFAEYYLLTDDPEMTADAYFNAMLSSSITAFSGIAPTRIVYSDYHDFDRAEEYGDVPNGLQTYLDVALWESLWSGGDVAVSNFFYQAIDMPDTTIFDPADSDRLPLTTYGVAMLETTDGYVLFRKHNFEAWQLNHPAVSYLPFYCEIIATGYSADGTPQWQAVTPIFVQ